MTPYEFIAGLIYLWFGGMWTGLFISVLIHWVSGRK